VPVLDAHLDPDLAERWVARFAEAEARLPALQVLEPRPAAPPPDTTGLDPLVAFRVAVACDGDVAGTFAAVRSPAHPRGPGLLARCAELVEAADADTLAERRDRLAELADRARLLAIVARSPPA